MVLHRAHANSHKIQQYTAHGHLYSSLECCWTVFYSHLLIKSSLMMTRRQIPRHQIRSFYIFCAFSRTRSTIKYEDFDLARKGEREGGGTLLVKSAFKGIHTQSIYRDWTRVFLKCVCAWFHTDLHYTLTQAWVSLVKPKYKLSLCKAHKGTLTEQTNTLKRKQTLSASVAVATN